MTPTRSLVAVVAVAACSHPPAGPPPPKPAEPPMLAALPAPSAVDTVRFAGVVVCDRCHTAGKTAMRDRTTGADISPVAEVQAGMMGLSARDPYYLAALRREIAANPGARVAIEAICNRCHAPVGFAESSSTPGGTLSLDDLTAGGSPAAVLGREGTGCAGCHSLDPATLGKEPSFTGAAKLRDDRVSYGALRDPLVEAMVQMARTTPVSSPHIGESRLCASCHTVLVRQLDAHGTPTGDEIPEQTTYLEWRNSELQNETAPVGPRAATCQGCHMPRSDDELGETPPIATPFSTRPPDAPIRQGYRRHALRGGNVYLLEQLARNADWLNTIDANRLVAAASGTRRFLQSAATLEVTGTRDALAITVVNHTGHKLPTGYPTRRMWLSITARDAGQQPVFVSGGHVDGAIRSDGKRLDGPDVIEPHRIAIDSQDQVSIWESVPVDAVGMRTHLLLGTAGIAKDNRLLPAGWRADHPDARRTRPIGIERDADFIPGRDTVIVKLPATTRTVELELLYQSIPPETIESYRPTDSPEAARFLKIVARTPQPIVLAKKTVTP